MNLIWFRMPELVWSLCTRQELQLQSISNFATCRLITLQINLTKLSAITGSWLSFKYHFYSLGSLSNLTFQSLQNKPPRWFYNLQIFFQHVFLSFNQYSHAILQIKRAIFELSDLLKLKEVQNNCTHLYISVQRIRPGKEQVAVKHILK